MQDRSLLGKEIPEITFAEGFWGDREIGRAMEWKIGASTADWFAWKRHVGPLKAPCCELCVVCCRMRTMDSMDA